VVTASASFSRNTLTPAGTAVIVCSVRLPKQIAVMPLPNAILFPRVLLPLYIFEPRYKQMLADCLKGERMFAVALLRRGWEQEGRNPTPHPIASIGVIRTCVARPDGSANVILEGVARVQISEYIKQRPYRVALVDSLEGSEDTVEGKHEPLLKAVAQLAKARARMGAELPKAVLSALRSVKNADYLSDLVSYTLLDDYYDKQAMLETLDTDERLKKLLALLQKKIQQFELWKTLQGKLPNKHVGHN
jgi:Lon protease-like protein